MSEKKSFDSVRPTISFIVNDSNQKPDCIKVESNSSGKEADLSFCFKDAHGDLECNKLSVVSDTKKDLKKYIKEQLKKAPLCK